MFIIVIGLLIPLWLFYKFYVSIYNYWESRGIVAEPGRFPFGNDINLVTMTESQAAIIDEMYKKHRSQPYFGFYKLRLPVLVVKSPEMIKLVLIKDFSYFRDRFSTKRFDSKEDKLQKHLFNLSGEEWRVLRAKLTPSFSSGKLKLMFSHFLACAENLSNVLQIQSDKSVNVKEITACYTTDTVCSCLFGWENNSVNEKENEMRKLGQNMMKMNSTTGFSRLLRNIFPGLASILKLRLTDIDIQDTLIQMVEGTIAYREANGIKQNNFFDLLLELKNKQSVENDAEKNGNDIFAQPLEMDVGMIAAQCYIFFGAGIETSSSVQSYCLYELALNPEIQRRLREEIKTCIKNHGGITYRAIQEMEYLDMVVSETMRLYPTVPTLHRTCTKDYTTPQGHKIKKYDSIIIPIWSLQHDSEYFPEPKKFDPERFSPQNKDKIKPFTYMPFGDGPRFCIGMLTIVIGLLIPLWLFYKFYVSIYNHWESRGIPAEPGRFPLGNDINFVTLKESQAVIIDKMCQRRRSQPYFGFYILRIPLLVVRSPEMIKLVLAKDFSYFRDRFPSKVFTSKEDKLQHHLFNLGGENWKALRAKLTPTFTSGKLKGMFPHFVACAEDLSNMLLSQSDKSVNVKDITACYTTDTVCSCVFGWENNSINEKENEMRKFGQNMMNLFKTKALGRLFRDIFPAVASFLKLRVIDSEIQDKLIKIVGDTIAYREANGIKRNDFLDLLIELKNKGSVEDDTKKNDTDVEPIEMDLGMITAQCFVFFIAGFETSSSVQSYCLYELALNPEIQKKLREEINTCIKNHGGITYQAIQEMEYLDMVVSETMRMYPTLPALNRTCTKDYTTPQGHKILKDDNILIPVFSLHRDSEYFPEPNKFDPERFSPKNKDKIQPFTYMPFGDGPRNCIGSRFGLIQTKVGIITILKNYEVSRTEETQVPLQFRGSFLIALTKGPITVKFTPKPLD